MKFGKHSSAIKIATIALSAGMLISCGSSKKGDAAAGLVTGVDGAVVKASDIELVISPKLAVIPPKQAGASLNLNETYDTDRTNSYVEERSLEVLNEAESILCYIAQTRFETQVNKGPYFAIVNGSLCEERQRDEQGGQDIMNMKVQVTREPNAPLNAVGWIKQEEDGEVNYIQWRLVIAEGSNSQNPLGIFRFNFGFKDEAGEQRGGGVIETGRTSEGVTLLFYDTQDMGERSGMSAASALMAIDANGTITGGKARMKKLWQEASYRSEESEYIVDFNDNFLAKVGSQSQTRINEEAITSQENACIDREQYNSVVYRYGLYKADGSRKNLNSGFPIEFEKNGVLRRGHASYWGVWTEGDVTLQNGDNINKVDWAGGEKATTPYTVIQAPGKLYKYTKNLIKLGDLLNTDLRMWDNGDNFIVQWNGTNFVKIGKEVKGGNGTELEPAEGTVPTPEWGFHFWADSLSANIGIPKDQILSDTLELSFHSQALVSDSKNVDLTLSCYSLCPKVDGSGGNIDTALEHEIRVNPSSRREYVFNATTKNLSYGGTAFVAPGPTTRDGRQEPTLVNSGLLLTAEQVATFGSQNISPWELQGKLDSYYSWQSSSESWGQFYGVKDAAGSIVQFDKPLELKYVHSLANDYDGKAENSNYGKTFRLNYGGFGDLWGIPWKQNEGDVYHKPTFSIKSGVTLQDAAGASYTLKALNVAQVLTSVEASSCSALAPSSAPALPNEDVVQVVDLGNEPGDDIAIRVIEGELVN